MKIKALAAVVCAAVLLCSCGADIKIVETKSEPDIQTDSGMLRPEQLLFHTNESDELLIGIGKNARVGIYEREVKAPYSVPVAHSVRTRAYNPGNDFPNSFSGFACGDKLAFLNSMGGEDFEIKISDDGGESWFTSEIEKDTEFKAKKMGFESHIGFTTQKDGWLAINSDTSSLSSASKAVTRIYFTNDGGKTWYRGNAPEDVDGLKIAGAFFETPLIGTVFYHDSFAFENRAEVRKTDDGGATWVKEVLTVQLGEVNNFSSFRLRPPFYVESKTLEEKSRWVLPVVTYYLGTQVPIDSFTMQDQSILKYALNIPFEGDYFNAPSFSVEDLYFNRNGIWELNADVFTNPEALHKLGATDILKATAQYSSTLLKYKTKTIETSKDTLLGFDNLPELRDETYGIYPDIRQLGYYITENDLLLFFEDTNTFWSKDIVLLLKQKAGELEAAGLHITGEGYIYL